MLDLSFLLDYTDYDIDLEYAEQLIRQYKDSLWLILSLVSTLVVIYGIILPQQNNAQQKKLEATLSLIDRWTAQGLAHDLLKYQQQVALEKATQIHAESKTRLCSFFHTVALLIKEKKIEEALIRKSQIGVGFICFYATLTIEQPDLLEKHSFYGPSFRSLHRRWRGLIKTSKGPTDTHLPKEFAHLFPGISLEASTLEAEKPHLRVLPRP